MISTQSMYPSPVRWRPSLVSCGFRSGLINKTIADKKYVSHKELVEVLRLRDADMFRTAMRKHLENHFKRLLSLDEKP